MPYWDLRLFFRILALWAILAGTLDGAMAQNHPLSVGSRYSCYLGPSTNSLMIGRKPIKFNKALQKLRQKLKVSILSERSRHAPGSTRAIRSLIKEIVACRSGKPPFVYPAPPSPPGTSGDSSSTDLDGTGGEPAVPPSPRPPSNPTPSPTPGPLPSPDDSDNDGLPDIWERNTFGTLFFQGSDDNDDDGLSNAREYLYGLDAAEPESNLLKNASFEQAMENWTSFSNAPADLSGIVSAAGRMPNTQSIRIENRDGGDIGISQTIIFSEPSQDPIIISYWAKIISHNSALQSLDIRVDYVNPTENPSEFILTPFMLSETSEGNWVKKEYILYPGRPIQSLVVLLLNYGAVSEVHYDDIKVYSLPAAGEMSFAVDSEAALTLSKSAYATSLIWTRGSARKHLLHQHSLPLSKILFSDGSVAESASITAIGPGLYEVFHTDTVRADIKTRIEIGTSLNSVNVTLNSVLNPYHDKEITRVQFINFSPLRLAASNADKDWALSAQEDEPFLTVTPLNVKTTCADSYVASGRQVACSVHREFGFSGARVAIALPQKSNYWAFVAALGEDYQTHLSRGIDGMPIRQSMQYSESYLFATLTPHNSEQLSALAQRGRIRQFLAIQPMREGSYQVPAHFSSLSDFIAAAQMFRNSGIKFGIHVLPNLISSYYPDNGLVNFSAPATPLSQLLWNVPFTRLSSAISANEVNLQLEINPTASEAFRHYVLGNGFDGGNWGYEFLIENEIVSCPSFSEYRLTCSRGRFNTTSAAHPQNAAISILPRTSPYSFFANPDSENGLFAVQNSFAEVLEATGADMIYFDGYPAPFPVGLNFSESRAYMHARGIIPYFDRLGRVPLVQFGGGSPDYGALYEARAATDDGIVFKALEQTKRKAESLGNWNPFGKTKPELGWWKLFGAQFDAEGSCTNSNDCLQHDHAAISIDEVHYALGKVLAYGSSVGIHMGVNYERHGRLQEIFDIIGLYNQIVESDRATALIPAVVREYLRATQNEVELTFSGGFYNFIKQHTVRARAEWTGNDSHIISVSNPFASQKLKLEMRAQPDFYPYSDSRHISVYDFSTMSGASVSGSSGAVTCSLNGRQLIVSNSGAIPGGCRISLPKCTDLLDARCALRLTSHRGIGIDMTGDSSGALAMARLQSSGVGQRDYKFNINFSGPRQVVLSDASTEAMDYLNASSVQWYDINQKKRGWEMNWALPFNTYTVSIFVTVPAHSSSSLLLSSVKLLAENGSSEITNPRIIVGPNEITFPVSLYVSDQAYLPNILSYNGYTRNYTLYTSNYEVVSSGTLSQDSISIPAGSSSLSISSDPSSLGRKANVILRLQDDANGDGIPDDSRFQIEPN